MLEVERAREWGAPAALGRALAVHARITGSPEALELLRNAVYVLERSANRYEFCRALLALGERIGPSAPEGEQALLRAHAVAVECGAPWLARAAERKLGTVRSTPPRSRVPLTPAELKVASLVASGLTNREIAEELGISRRAVEKTLTNCYRKMSIKRSDLARALHELDQQLRVWRVPVTT